MPAKKAYCLMKEGKRVMQKLKKTTAMLMTVLILFGTFAGNASAIGYAEDTGMSGTRVASYDGFKTVSPIAAANKYEAQAVSDKDSAADWTTVSCMPYSLNNNTTYTVSAKGNDIKIVIKSEYINGDKLYCAGTKSAEESPLYGKADGIDIFQVCFSDTDSYEPNTNHLTFSIADSCGENKDGHYISASKDAVYNLYYDFYEENGTNYVASVGQYYDNAGKLRQGDYCGKKSECKKLNISISGDTMTVTATIPYEVVDYYNESKRELKFDSENLVVSGEVQNPFYQTVEASENNTDFVNRMITRIKEIFEKFFELLKKFFTFNF